MNGVSPRAVVIGASAGALQALSQILPELPSDFPVPVLIVVHIPADRRNMLAPLFQAKCRMLVREAEDKEPAMAGTIYFAPPGYHLLAEADGTLSLSSDEEVLYSRPSVDVLFESAADAYGSNVIGIILTGANPDGAQGLRAIGEAGGSAIVEDPAGAYADTMPEEALKACPTAQVMTLGEIAAHLLKVCPA
ncbi:chemotaxis protein CheB [Sphingomonas abietis]|uniref:protein-glutamate methylesterase n=1 Tax=Sphingomonas abietis TaxID=3012344 RepID=A0ABY7NRL4_9SPHN|nr:chemotaxis protein CheB [Sphingomonas abietis]WBO23197.1 chemotaxis protein CheB [Sphingomonas abietis]